VVRRRWRGRYGDLAAGSGAGVMERRSGETDFGSSRACDWGRGRAAGILHDEILSVLVVITQQSDAATRASTLSPENQHAEVYDRMPVLLKPEQFDHWVSGNMTVEELKPIENDYLQRMVRRPIRTIRR